MTMTVPAAGTWASSNTIPQTQNTAPVLEFRCLYTADLRRKQKRWQDGRLKFHTFNKRVMVYDDRCNFVGDSYWREDHVFGEGEELELERCGILVEVSECVRTREQDLTPLLNKVVKDRQERAHVRALASCPLRPSGLAIRTQTVGLSRVESTDLRLAKRRRPNNSPTTKNGYAQNLTGATLALSSTPPAAAALLSYDLAWARSSKQPIEDIEMSNSTGDNRIYQETSVRVGIIQNKPTGSEPKRHSRKSSPARFKSGYARNITGTVLVLKGRGLPPASGAITKVTTQFGENDPGSITIEEDEFTDIDIYGKDNPQVGKTTKLCSPVTDPAKNHQKKHLPRLLHDQPYCAGDRPDRPFNPLRIRTRPKRKLLSSATPPPRPPSLHKLSVENGNEAISPPASPKCSREKRIWVPPVPQAASITETRLIKRKGSCSPSPVNAGMDPNGIDMLLTRKASGQKSIADEIHTNVHARTKITNFDLSAEESTGPKRFEGQNVVLSILTSESTQKIRHSPSQLSTFCGNADTDIEKVRQRRNCRSNNFESPPRLMKSFSEGAQANELRGSTIITAAEDIKILRPTFEAGRDLAIKREVLPFKPPVKLSCLTTQSTKLVRRDYKQGGCKNVMQSVIARTGPAVVIPEENMAFEGAIVNRDRGPWSREAFDLFDWKPCLATTGDSLAIC